MPGLLNDPEALDQPYPKAVPDDPGPMGADTVPDDAGGEQASPEDQARYEEFVKTGFGMMYSGGKVNEDILKLLDDDPSDLVKELGDSEELRNFTPVVALGATAAIVTLQVVRETKEQDGAIILQGGKDILDDLSQVALSAGIREYSQDEVNQAMHIGADLYRHAAQEEGLIDLDQAKEEWGQITAADKEGRLGEVIPQFAGVQEQPPPDQQEAPDG